MRNSNFADTNRHGDKMAEKQDETLLNNTLKHDEIPIAIELAVALRADEVDKFLELYDSIPKTVQTERVDKIKEMARQLAAFPKKQFDMYRPKPRGFVSGEHFTLSSSTLNAKDKLLSNHLNEVYSNKSEDLDLKDIIPDVPKNSVDADEMTVALTKSAKKKSKKKKKKVSTASDQASSICNGELKPTSEGEKDSEVVIENKFLDSDGSGSRVATMNKNMVADISVVSPSVSDSDATKKVSNSTVNHSSDHETKDCDFEENLLDSEGTENEDIKDPDTENNDLPDITKYTSPPFGYPLATDKLIQSAIELLSCGPSKESNKTDQDRPPNDNETRGFEDSSSVSINSPVDVDGSIDGNDSSKNATSSPDPIDLKHKVDESIDGDVSNLSAWEDEGWQSQGRRSHRKKKKELASRDRSNSNQKNKKDLQKENKQNNNNFKRQNPRNTHNRNSNDKSNNNFLQGAKTSQDENKNSVDKMDKNALEMDNCAPGDIKGKSPKEGNNSEVESKAAFSYRDALVKAKPKPTEELHYNSDSGVDVNSVGSCDSAIHSPKMPNEFDLEEAVNFFMKGCNEVAELHKQGKVVYYSGIVDPLPTNRKKPFRKGWHARPKHHK